MKYWPQLTGFFFLCMVNTSCNKTDDFAPDYKYEYFPLNTLHTVIYDVDSINVDEFTSSVDTFHFQVKEVIGDTFIDLEGDLAYEIFRYKRFDITGAWGSPRLWWVKRTVNNLQKIEENLRFIKLTFPPVLDQSWDGNGFIVIDEDDATKEYLADWEYQYTDIDAPETINGLIFDSTLTVLHIDNETLLRKTFSTEVYAKHVGLVYKELVFLNSQRTDLGFDWDNPEKWNKDGFILRMKVNSYSN